MLFVNPGFRCAPPWAKTPSPPPGAETGTRLTFPTLATESGQTELVRTKFPTQAWIEPSCATSPTESNEQCQVEFFHGKENYFTPSPAGIG
jgi:hypothetical protein